MARALLISACVGLGLSVPLPGSSTWSTLAPMNSKRSDMSATVIDSNGRVLLVGGCSGNQQVFCPNVTNTCEIYDPREGGSSVGCPAAPNPRYRHTAAFVDGKVWLFGGRTVSDDLVTAVDTYDVATNTWQSLKSWADATSDLSSFVLDGTIYVAGGYNAIYDTTDSIASFSGGAWTTNAHTAMDQARGDFSAVTVPGQAGIAWVVGGFHHGDWCQALDHFERYNVASNSWEVLPSLKYGRADKAVAAVEGGIYVIGGEVPSNCSVIYVIGGDGAVISTPLPTTHVEFYDVATGNWSELSKFPEQRFRFAAAAHEDSVFVFGGQLAYDEACSCYAVSNHVARLGPELDAPMATTTTSASGTGSGIFATIMVSIVHVLIPAIRC